MTTTLTLAVQSLLVDVPPQVANPMGLVLGTVVSDGMGTIPDPADGFLPILLLVIVAVGFALSQLLTTHVLGPSRMGATKAIPYESGVDPVGDTRQPFVVQYYLVAILFLLFDIELAFLYPWAAVFSDEALKGFQGRAVLMLVSMTGFLGILAIAFYYEWRKGILDWNPRKPQLSAAEVAAKAPRENPTSFS